MTATGYPLPTRTPLQALRAPLGVAALPAAGAVALLLHSPFGPGHPWLVCPIRATFGIDCPGCGGLRATYSLLHGDVLTALHYNGFALALLAMMGWAWAAWLSGRLRGRQQPSWWHWKWTPLALPVVMILWMVLRNLPFAPFTALFV